MQNRWLVEFKGRNYSGEYDQNFLWQHKSIYIMDNHRAAFWCWLQHLSANKKYNLFHIDRHYDALSSRIDEWKSNAPDFGKLGIRDYLDFRYETDGSEVPLVRYDNYLALFFELYADYINECIFATHREGDPPRFDNVLEKYVWHIPENLEFWLSNGASEWIFNLDFDFFFYGDGGAETIMFSNNYIECVFNAIRKKYLDGTIAVLTICLSPEWCGGWEATERVCEKFCKIMGLDFTLPKQ